MYNNHAMTNLMQVQKKNCTDNTSSASILVKTLIKLGVENIFGYPGAAVLSIYNELAKTNEIKHYLVRHEQAAVHAAEGYARVSGKCGVVLVTSGPGFTNTITGIANAYADSTPLVILAGDVTGDGNKIFQNVDIIGLSQKCCKKAYKLADGDDIEQVIEEAFSIANSGVKGPVVVALPRNILESEYAPEPSSQISHIAVDTVLPLAKVNDFLHLLRQAQKPLVLIGGGCINASEELESFIAKVRCPVVSTLMGIGTYPSENNLYLGMIGLNGCDSANELLNQCDLLIAMGVSFSDRSTCKNEDFFKKFKIVNINIDFTSEKFILNIESDIKDFLSQVLRTDFNFTPNEKWLMLVDSIKDEYILPENGSKKLHSSDVLATLSEFTKYYEPIVVTDVGQHQMLTAQYFNFNKPRQFITSGGLGTMGFGLPAAIGAHIANPNTLVLNITGDGSFQMNLQELATCREHSIPVKIIIMNNSYLGMVRQLQERIYNTRYQVEMINPDFTKIAEAYDLFAVRVTREEELIPALETAINHNGTAIIDIVIDSFENI